MDQEKKNFEINLLPVISLLAVLISFLLLTAVWVNIGSLDVLQGLGTETEDNQENPPSLWAKFEQDGSLTLLVKDAPEVQNQFREVRFGGEKMWENLEEALVSFKGQYPDFKTALVLPQAESNYAHVIKALDIFKRSGLDQLGVAPL